MLTLLITFSANISAQEKGIRTIEIEGKSSVKVVPENVIFTFHLSVQDSDYTRCAEAVLLEASRLKEEFIRHGIDKDIIKTLSYSVREIKEFDRSLGKTIFKGYRADIPLRIQTNLKDAINSSIFTLVKKHAPSDLRINFELSDAQTESIKNKLIEGATDDARKKASILAKNLKINTGKIVRIQYGDPSRAGFNPGETSIFSRSEMASDVNSVAGIENLVPNEIEMRTHVFIIWELE